MSDIPAELRYAASHEWLRDDGDGLYTLGITDHAQIELGDLVYVELPEIGRRVTAGEAVAVVESVKAASDIYAPAAGEIVEVNSALADAPEAVNQSPYGEGWLLRIRLDATADGLLDADGYAAQIG